MKQIKKLYQATIDGGYPSFFHKKCNNIPNTLVLYKSLNKYCIRIQNDAIKNPSLKTNEIIHKEIFDDDINALSEDGKFEGIFAKEYEVFEIIF